jgi:hypothetical protein
MDGGGLTRSCAGVAECRGARMAQSRLSVFSACCEQRRRSSLGPADEGDWFGVCLAGMVGRLLGLGQRDQRRETILAGSS